MVGEVAVVAAVLGLILFRMYIYVVILPRISIQLLFPTLSNNIDAPDKHPNPHTPHPQKNKIHLIIH